MNYMSPRPSSGGFTDSIFALLDRVEYRRIVTTVDFDEVSRLRQTSYESKVFIDNDNFGTFVDASDFGKDCYVIGVYIDEQLISTVRLHVVSMQHFHGPSVSLFPKITQELLSAGHTLIDPSRFATDPVALWQFPTLPFLTLRAAAMATEFFDADYCMSVVRADSSSFYKRCFGAKDMSSPQIVPGYSVPLTILASKTADIREKIATRYPFFQSEPYERRMMFAPQEELTYPSLNILPSAKYAHRRNLSQAAATYPSTTPA
jgi:hypothetical protein